MTEPSPATATGQNFQMFQGDDKILVVTVYDNDDFENVVNISGATIQFVIYKQTTGQIVVTKSSGSGITITDAENGELEITLAGSDTASLYGTFLHECELTDSTGNVSTIMTGYAKIYASRT